MIVIGVFCVFFYFKLAYIALVYVYCSNLFLD